MANLYADENFPKPVVEHLRKLGHNVLTAYEAGRANQAIPDDQVLKEACATGRAVLTLNRKHFKRLHEKNCDHAGIIICTEDFNVEAFAARIDGLILKNNPLSGKLIRVTRG